MPLFQDEDRGVISVALYKIPDVLNQLNPGLCEVENKEAINMDESSRCIDSSTRLISVLWSV